MNRTNKRFVITTGTLLFLLNPCEGLQRRRFGLCRQRKHISLMGTHGLPCTLPIDRGGGGGGGGGTPKAPPVPNQVTAVTEQQQQQQQPEFTIGSILGGNFNAMDVVSGFVARSTDPDRVPYLISFLLSAVYFYYFSFTEPPVCDTYSDGFCVMNMVKEENCPGEALPCKTCRNPINSHVLAWKEDVIFTVISIVLPWTPFTPDTIHRSDRIALPLLILGHGYLHRWIGGSVHQCYIPADSDNLFTAKAFYTLFTASLTAIMFFLFSDLPSQRNLLFIWFEVVAITAVIVRATLAKVHDGNSISALFLSTQLLTSYLGAYHPSPKSTKLVGQTFIFPCVVSLLEFLRCDWLSKVGGHAWYDFFLHISIVATFLPSDWDLLKLFKRSKK